MGLEQGIAIAAGPLGRVHGRVGIGHQFVAIPVVGVHHHADRACNLHLFARHFKRLRQGGKHTVGDGDAVGRVVHVFEQHQKLVAPHAGHRIALAGFGAQAVGGPHQDGVSCGVPKRIVDGLEAVQIHKQHTQALFDAVVVGALQAQQGVDQSVFKQQAVGKPGQCICKRTLLQFSVGVFQLGIALLQ
ncbi:hypothetical protein D3C71_1654600 [compost metagenome]